MEKRQFLATVSGSSETGLRPGRYFYRLQVGGRSLQRTLDVLR